MVKPITPSHGAAPQKSGIGMIYKYIAVVLVCLTVGAAAGYMISGTRTSTTTLSGPIRVGENMVYGIYAGGSSIGTLNLWVDNTETFDGGETYVANYTLIIGTTTQGAMRVDENGRIRHAILVQASGGALSWATVIAYSYVLGMMRMIVEDNRVPENYGTSDTTYVMSVETTVPIGLWYLLRADNMSIGRQRAFYINNLPEGLPLIPARTTVTGEETVQTPLGSFECWTVYGENTTANMWVAKDGSRIVKASETVDNITLTYTLESYS